jgi:cell division protein FtsW
VWGIIILLTLLLLPPLIETGLVHHSRRWFRFGAMGFQPSEFAKIVILVYLAAILTKKGEGINDFYRGFLPPFLVVSLVSFLVFLEPDFSTAFILFFIALIMFFIAGIRALSLVSLVFVSIPALLLMIGGKGYRRERITGFLNPWADPTDKGYQIIQSFKAFAFGGLTGVGLGNSTQKIRHLPIPHTDYIFAIIAEEIGFIGVLGVVFLYMIIAYRGFRIALAQRDSFYYYLAFGITSLIVWEAVLNIAVVTGLMPSTGISLPFLSYGGSSLLTKSILIGILLSISRGRSGAVEE